MNQFVNRMVQAAKLDSAVYEEVEADETAMGQAIGVVVLSSVAAGIGTIYQLGISGIILGTVAALVGWFLWAFLVYLIGTRLLPEPQTQATYGELLRTIGFSSSPGIIRILGGMPVLGGIFFLGAGIWMLIAMIVAVRQALDYQGTWRAVAVCLIGWVVQVLVLGGVMALTGAGPMTPPA